MEGQKRSGSPWAWVAVAAILAVAGVAVAFILTRNNGNNRVTITHASQAVKHVSHHARSKPKVIVKTRTVVQSAPATAVPSSAPGGLAACDQNIRVNANTSCPFADNVFAGYAQAVQGAGGPGSWSVDAYSPATGQNYTDTCYYSSVNGVVQCSHGGDLIRFPYWAAAVYNR